MGVDPNTKRLLLEVEHEVRVMTHETSPFGNGNSRPYTIIGREPIPLLVTAVTEKYEQDWDAILAKRNTVTTGYLPLCVAPIELYTWDTSNGKKISILLEELGLPYVVKAVHIVLGEQNTEDFKRINPNSKIPAISDPNEPSDGVTLFESGAILIHLAERYGDGSLLPTSGVARAHCLQWLFFQVGDFGPIAEQLHHFLSLSGLTASAEAAAYGLERFTKEVHRQYSVMDTWLSMHRYFGGEVYTIADIAIFSQARRAPKHNVDLAKDFPNVKRWLDVVMARPAVQRGLLVPSEDAKERPVAAKKPRL